MVLGNDESRILLLDTITPPILSSYHAPPALYGQTISLWYNVGTCYTMPYVRVFTFQGAEQVRLACYALFAG